MITKQKKQEIVSGLIEKLKGVQGVYVLDFTGVTVFEAIKLRRAFKNINVNYVVAKNSLIKRALSDSPELKIPDNIFIGPSGLVFSYDDPIAPAKVIRDIFDKDKRPALKGAVLDGQFFDGSKLKELASLPGKKDMMASIVGSLHAPISGIVGSINAVMRDVAYLVEEVAKKKAS
ncbi:MAG: 50S ribosomal protein L10 [bacterium]